MLRRIYIFSFLASALMLISCNRDNGIGEPHLLGEDISFSPTIVKEDWSAVRSNNPNPPSTKGTVTNDLSSVGVMAFMSTSLFDDVVSSIQPNLMYNQKLTKKGASSDWGASTTFYWPVGGNNTSFFAYSPYAEVALATNGISVSVETDTGIPKVTYSMPLEVVNQPDLLIATSHKDIATSSNPSSVNLSFEHALAAISFNFQGMGGEVLSNVGISGIYDEGTINMDNEGTPVWGALRSTGRLYEAGLVGAGAVRVLGSGIVNITASNGHIMVIPQEHTTTHEVHFAIDGHGYEVQLPSTGQWEKGLRYRYNIVRSLSEITITLFISEWDELVLLVDDLTGLSKVVASVDINDWKTVIAPEDHITELTKVSGSLVISNNEVIDLEEDHITELAKVIDSLVISNNEVIVELEDHITELAKILGTTTTDGWDSSVDNDEDKIQ